MPQDFARKKSATPAKKRPNRRVSKKKASKAPIPAWLWLLTGGLVGAFTMFLLHLNGLAPAAPAPSQAAVEPTTKNEQASNSEKVPDTRLQFYDLLKENEVAVPDSKIPEIRETVDDSLYILQAGSFRQATDASRMRAELILLNLDAVVEQVTLSNGQIWHRVVVGPYSNRSQMTKARNQLVANNINPLVLKRPK
ncbi:SPOR domain-containing protein [Halioxenophilus sp. WMMB6]|uniref:SPOR domain-containing protein n=1 Tax=Halioxenophilus sp. WMMB6 TaxID=3073815 RepID=UPI00295E4EC6|nr:SPOR domain-containing protein [Halioxenophilus sp. WMMB6]